VGAHLSLGNCADVIEYPFMPVREAVAHVRREADATVLVGSFCADEQRYCSMLFPSRLVAYCATGLPCAAYARADFPGAMWLMHNVSPEVVFATRSHAGLVRFIRQFTQLSTLHSWGRAMFTAGARDFDFENARDQYFQAFATA
jgi:hypothetical protein